MFPSASTGMHVACSQGRLKNRRTTRLKSFLIVLVVSDMRSVTLSISLVCFAVPSESALRLLMAVTRRVATFGAFTSFAVAAFF